VTCDGTMSFVRSELVPNASASACGAPRAGSVALKLSDGFSPMRSEPEGWFALTTDRADRATYRTSSDGLLIPTRACAVQPEGVSHDEGS